MFFSLHFFWVDYKYLPSVKRTQHPKMDGWKMKFLFGLPIFRGELLVLGSVFTIYDGKIRHETMSFGSCWSFFKLIHSPNKFWRTAVCFALLCSFLFLKSTCGFVVWNSHVFSPVFLHHLLWAKWMDSKATATKVWLFRSPKMSMGVHFRSLKASTLTPNFISVARSWAMT